MSKICKSVLVLASSIVLGLSGFASATPISSGTYHGADGVDSGNGFGTAGQPGYIYNSPISSDNIITGGTFIGGNGGPANASGTFDFGGFGGAGLEVDGTSVNATIHNGSFTGGNGGLYGPNGQNGSRDGDGGDALLMFGISSVTADGGSFNAGTGY